MGRGAECNAQALFRYFKQSLWFSQLWRRRSGRLRGAGSLTEIDTVAGLSDFASEKILRVIAVGGIGVEVLSTLAVLAVYLPWLFRTNRS